MSVPYAFVNSARKFPVVDLESRRYARWSRSKWSSASEGSCSFPPLLPLSSNVDDVELGFFSDESCEQIHMRKLQESSRWIAAMIALVLFGVFFWIVSLGYIIRG
jgi:hypothetical protein